MYKNGKLKDKQTKNYVMYYIFHNEEPVYVGVTNSFDRRKNEHFSETYRSSANGRSKELYRQISENSICDYEIFIVAQTKKAQHIDDLERAHIKMLRGFGLAKANVADGGDYVKYIDTAREMLAEFRKDFKRIEKTFVDSWGEIDLSMIPDSILELDFNILRSAYDCKEYELYMDYEYYLKHTADKYVYDFESYIENEMEMDMDCEVSPRQLVCNILSGYGTKKHIKDRSIDRLISVIDKLENSIDSVEVYVGLKTLLSDGYEDDIYQALSENGYEHYGIIDEILS